MAFTKTDLTGSTFGRLTVIGLSHRTPHGNLVWICECGCENKTKRLVQGSNLRSGDVLSCGCLRRERIIEKNTTHGLSNHPLYSVWKGMKQRCYNRNAEDYGYYGGRGIRVCAAWENDFECFLNWAMVNGYRPDLTLDRYPNQDGNYEPDNCRFVTMTEQNRNRRNNVIPGIETARSIREDTRPRIDISASLGVPLYTVRDVKSGRNWNETDPP